MENNQNQTYNDPVMQAMKEGHTAVLATGNIFDYQWDSEKNSATYRPYYVADQLFEKGYFVIRYSRSSGLTVYRERDVKKSGELNDLLRKSGLSGFKGEKDFSPTEVIEVFRGIKMIATTPQKTPVAFMIDYTSNLCGRDGSVEERITVETLNDIACLPKSRRSGNYLIAYANEECNLSPLLKNMHKVNFGYPTLDEHQAFIKYLNQKDEYAVTDLNTTDLAKVCRGLQLRQIESIFKAAKVNGQTVTRNHVLNEKKELIERMSEGTLTVLDTDITFDDMAGLDVVKDEMLQIAQKLSQGDESSPRAILLPGPPGTGKSTIVRAFANACGFTLVELSDSIKSKWVGESESRLQLALNLVVALEPVVLMIDEIDQTFSNRSATSNDGGVASHYLKTIFKFAARDDLRGKLVIVGCSNTPQLLDPAMIDRFGVTIPLLEATPDDIVRIFPKIEKRINDGKETLDPNSKVLRQAAEILFSKGASPRQIFDIIARTKLVHGSNYTDADILESCQHYRGNSDPISTAYSSLSAIKLTAFSDYFPWIKSPKTFSYPWYLEDIVDKNTGEINELELNKKLDEFARKSKF